MRAMSALNDVMARFPEGRVAIVTHSVVVQVLAAQALSLDLRFLHRVRADNAGITTLCGRQAPGSLISLNVTTMEAGAATSGVPGGECAPAAPRRIAS